VARLGAASPLCALDAAGPEGWGTRPGGSGSGTSILALDPEVEFRGGLEALEAALDWVAAAGRGAPLAALLVGALSYDLGRSLESLPVLAMDDLETPPVWLAGFRAVYRYDPIRHTGEVVGSDADAVARLLERIRAAEGGTAPPSELPGLPPPRESEAAARFLEGVRAVQRWIEAGDVYQVNLARRLELEPVARGAAVALYAHLTARAGAPFSAYLDAGDFRVVSNSPERFLRVEGERVESCPIKGTRPRGATPTEDRWRAKELLASPKDRAEHVMIVDLERNDLGRVCRTGSVRVERMAELRSYASVHHMVSSVQGCLRDPGDAVGLLRATFPGGSITGAPKIRAMEIIEALEPVRRGIYTGSIGWIDASGALDLSIAIRTAVARDGALYLHLGGGIVADSSPEEELRETQHKGHAFSALWEASA
jgi:para-aminobenzoate synthetase component 1